MLGAHYYSYRKTSVLVLPFSPGKVKRFLLYNNELISEVTKKENKKQPFSLFGLPVPLGTTFRASAAPAAPHEVPQGHSDAVDAVNLPLAKGRRMFRNRRLLVGCTLVHSVAMLSWSQGWYLPLRRCLRSAKRCTFGYLRKGRPSQGSQGEPTCRRQRYSSCSAVTLPLQRGNRLSCTRFFIFLSDYGYIRTNA